MGMMEVPPDKIDGVNTLATKMKKEISERRCPGVEWTLEDFELGALVGKGTFADVYLARDRKAGLMVALKIMEKRHLIKEKYTKQVLKEIEIHRKLRHPHILSLFTYFHDADRLYLVLEFAAGGSVYSALKQERRFSNQRAAKYIFQVSQALSYCHSQSIIHRDIKPENLLLDINDDIKLSDFGWAIILSSSPVSTICGTTEYFPPEMVEMKKYNTSVDLWCLGVLCFEFLVGKNPFESETKQEMYMKILDAEITFPKTMSISARKFISSLVRYNPRSRLSLSKVKMHGWIQKNYLTPQKKT